ncbi:ribokinase [Curtobacterium sp. MWU13-2055]|uniref:ribokinase n=1 Tax=Curtobacterium sp. MWU13-2055 TaxID=2931928 RepID=UPI00200EB476|nr:ribokinase [Curtobacterium sp. MWU13-2055]
MTVLFVGTANLDTTAEVTKLPAPGHTVVARRSRTGAGGKSANQAAAAGRLGAHVKLIAAVGDDADGRVLTDALRSAGVDTSTVVRTTAAPTGSAFIAVGDDAENQIVVIAGANDELRPTDVSDHWPEDHHLIVSVAMEGPAAPIQTAVERAVSGGHRVVLNASPVTNDVVALLAAADPVIVNEHEARELVNDPSAALDVVAAAVLELGARSVVITAGSAGAVVAEHGQQITKISGVRIAPVDTTGAGDAFAGALCAELDQGASLVAGARFACKVAAHSVQHHGAQSSYPARKDL